MDRHDRARRVPVALLSVLTVVSGLFVVLATSPAGAMPKPTPVGVTTAAEVIAAAHEKDRLAVVVGRLNAQVAQAQIAATQARGRFQLSEQRVALAQQREQDAKAAAAKAQAVLRKANNRATAAHVAYVNYIQAAYYGETVDGTAGSLLTASDPSDVLERSTLQRYQADTKIDAIAQYQSAQIVRSNADARARAATVKAQQLTLAAKKAVVQAKADYLTAQSTEAALATQKANQDALLTLAKNTLAAKQTARANYLTYTRQLAEYQAQQRAIAEAKAEALREARERARERAREHSGSSNGGGSSSGSGGGGGSSNAPGPSAPGGGSWTAAKGQKAANRALSLLGQLYIFAGGNKYGPTAGGCTDPIAPCGTLGYDCSGLVLYAWYSNWAHFAATQYWQAGSYHPSSDDFRPGDLLFWSENGTVGGIGHVAVYIGNGNVVQAPQSGDVVKITPWYAVESGYFGATRPLT